MLIKINYPGNDKSSDLDIRNIPKDWGTYFSNLAEILDNKLPNSQYKGILEPIKQFDLPPIKKCYILNMFGDITTWKAAGTDKFPDTLKYGVDVLAKLITPYLQSLNIFE